MFFEFRWVPKFDWPELFSMEVFAGVDEDGEIFYNHWHPEIPTAERHDKHVIVADRKVEI